VNYSEINPRLSASVEIAVRSGVDFPYLLYQWTNGQAIYRVQSYRVGGWMRYLKGDIMTTIEAIQHRGRPGVTPPVQAIFGFCASFLVPMGYDDYFDWKDSVPAFIASRDFTSQWIGGSNQKATIRFTEKDEGTLYIMCERVRVFVAACFYYSGLVRLAHWWTRRSRQYLIILNYHRAAGDNLRHQLCYLHHHYRILHLETALEELYTPRKNKTQARDRRIPLVLTFDDGYHDNYTLGFALARELQIPITIFLIPGYQESGEYFWWLEGKRLVNRAQVEKVTIEGQIFHLNQAEERDRLAQAIDAQLRHSRSVAERDAFLRDIRESLNVPTAITVEEEATLPLTWAEVREMEESGLVSFGAHTMHHPILSYLSDPEEIRREVYECRTVLEQRLGHPVRAFAYPIGKFEHIGEEGLKAVKAARYEWALTTIEALNTPQTDPCLLKRLPGDIEQHWLVMASELVGLLAIFSRIKKNYKKFF